MKRESTQVLYGAASKRRKRPQLQLSNLPMNILCSVISKLPTRDAIRTSTLSSQWRYVWCDHTDHLTFDGSTFICRSVKFFPPYYATAKKEEFNARVDAILQQHSGEGVQRMQVKYALDNKSADHLDRWVSFAIASKTKELTLFLSDRRIKSFIMYNEGSSLFTRPKDLYSFPCHFFDARNSSYLRCLQLASVYLKPPADFSGIRNLTRLSLVDVDVEDGDLEGFLSHCSKALEFLEIAYCGTLTAIRATRLLNKLKHLRVGVCDLLEKVEMNCCCLTTLEYMGPMVSLAFGETSSLKDVCVKFMDVDAALDYINMGFPSTLSNVEMLYMHCIDRQRVTLPIRPLKFVHLRHLRLELVISECKDRKIDVLDYAHLLEVAPFMERLELHMWIDCPHQPYNRRTDGEVRSNLPSHRHDHLKWVYITGFFGYKDQVELVLQILRSSAVLKRMIISSRVIILHECAGEMIDVYRNRHAVDGRMIAVDLCKEHADIVEVLGAV
uniref:Uncharacterized protein n=1 Tax=Avena sativa TaxID=4498 RepID=A0ACD5Y2C3_AVESA